MGTRGERKGKSEGVEEPEMSRKVKEKMLRKVYREK